LTAVVVFPEPPFWFAMAATALHPRSGLLVLRQCAAAGGPVVHIHRSEASEAPHLDAGGTLLARHLADRFRMEAKVLRGFLCCE